MALKGADISATYQDWVHVNKAGAGLADHLGAEAALYLDDGAGGVDQICGRTAVRHWLDPHPDAAAFAETWEFSTKGTMTQGALETAGWTFENCTASVSNGALWLSAPTGTAIARASIAVSLDGDFDFTFVPCYGDRYSDLVYVNSLLGFGGVGDTVSDVAHYLGSSTVNPRARTVTQINGTWAGLAGTGANLENYSNPVICRISRVSGTVYLSGGNPWPSSLTRNDDPATTNSGWYRTQVSDATTFNKFFLTPNLGAVSSGSAKRCGFLYIRRFQ